MKMTQGNKERWQTLYELGQKKKEEQEILRKNYQDIKEQQEVDFSFQPQIYSKNTTYDPSNRVGGESLNKINIVERTKIWAENKQKKLELLKDQIVDKDIGECTFQPQIKNDAVRSHKRQGSIDSARNSIEPGQSVNGQGLATKSVERYVQRMNVVRQQKIEQEQDQKKAIGSGNVWQNKVTVPKDPKFNLRAST